MVCLIVSIYILLYLYLVYESGQHLWLKLSNIGSASMYDKQSTLSHTLQILVNDFFFSIYTNASRKKVEKLMQEGFR